MRDQDVWDIATGERLLEDEAFRPMAQHPIAHGWIMPRLGGVFVEARLEEDLEANPAKRGS